MERGCLKTKLIKYYQSMFLKGAVDRFRNTEQSTRFFSFFKLYLKYVLLANDTSKHQCKSQNTRARVFKDQKL